MPGHMLLYKNGNYEIKTYFKTKLTPGKWNRKTNMDQLRSQLAEMTGFMIHPGSILFPKE